MEIRCPSCGEQDLLRGQRRASGTIKITCDRCGHSWERDAWPRCRLCGSERLIRTPKPLLAHGRGTQTTPAGHYDAYACADCGGHDVTSSHAHSDT